MDKQRKHFVNYYIGLPVVVLSLFSCMLAQDQARVSQELLYPAQVPASFDTVLLIRASDPRDNKTQFEWSAENGTIRGEGESVTWNTPSEFGTYKIDVKAINASGHESLSQASIDVVPLNITQVDPDPEINLKLPIIGSSMMSEQSLVGPLTNAEISCDAPLSNINNYKYSWSCNGGKIQAAGLKDGAAFKIGWYAPGMPGNYTVMVKATDRWGNITVGSVYFQVKNPACCEKPDTIFVE